MKKNWKTSLGKCIYNFNDELKIYDNYLYRWLTFSSPYIQTLICKFKLHSPELQYIKPLTIAARYKKNNTCLLGLGGGGLAHYLNKLDIELTIIEKNQIVIDTAHKYFELKQLNNLQIINTDAYKFTKDCQNQYSHLLIDIYDAYNFPHQCLNLDFFVNCKSILKQNGVLAINVCNNQELQLIYNYLSLIFPAKIIRIPIDGFTNNILLASENYSINNIIKIYAKHSEIKRLEWDKEFGYIMQYKF